MLSDLNAKYSQIMKDIEKDLNNKEELEYVKQKVNDIFIMFMEEVNSIADKYEDRMQVVLEKQAYLDEKMEKVEKTISNIQKDIYVDDEEYDFQIVCPYCNHEFVEDFENELKKEVRCPECENVIELDWNDDEHEGCSGNCNSCGHDCSEEYDDEDM